MQPQIPDQQHGSEQHGSEPHGFRDPVNRQFVNSHVYLLGIQLNSLIQRREDYYRDRINYVPKSEKWIELPRKWRDGRIGPEYSRYCKTPGASIEISRCQLMGYVVLAIHKNGFSRIHMDDGTGIIRTVINDDMITGFTSRFDIKVGMLLHVFGFVCPVKTVFQVAVSKLRVEGSQASQFLWYETVTRIHSTVYFAETKPPAKDSGDWKSAAMQADEPEICDVINQCVPHQSVPGRTSENLAQIPAPHLGISVPVQHALRNSYMFRTSQCQPMASVPAAGDSEEVLMHAVPERSLVGQVTSSRPIGTTRDREAMNHVDSLTKLAERPPVPAIFGPCAPTSCESNLDMLIMVALNRFKHSNNAFNWQEVLGHVVSFPVLCDQHTSNPESTLHQASEWLKRATDMGFVVSTMSRQSQRMANRRSSISWLDGITHRLCDLGFWASKIEEYLLTANEEYSVSHIFKRPRTAKELPRPSFSLSVPDSLQVHEFPLFLLPDLVKHLLDTEPAFCHVDSKYIDAHFLNALKFGIVRIWVQECHTCMPQEVAYHYYCHVQSDS